MRKLLFLLLVFPFCVSAQFTDNFSDGDFMSGPASWSGDTGKFEVDTANKLHLNAPAVTDTAYLSTFSAVIDSTEWNFYLQLDFSPSDNNLTKIYLVSDQADLSVPSINGYYLKIGENGSLDAIELYEQNGTTSNLIIRGSDGLFATAFSARIKITRDSIGNWDLFVDPSGGTNFQFEGTVFDNTHTTSNFFGVFCKYTSTRSDLFYFDDFYVGPIIPDTLPPAISSLTVISDTALDVKFSKVVEQTSAETPGNYSVNNGMGNPSSAVRDGADSSIVHLTFSTAFSNCVTNTLVVTNVEDLNSNQLLADSTNFIYCLSDTASYRDVVINEIFADPSPQIGLPNAEFVELYNRSGKVFDLNGWEFSDGTTNSTLGTHILLPDDYVILCSTADVSLYSPYGPVLGLSSWPTINNTGDNLTLKDNTSLLIDAVNYTDSWYNDNTKDGGGWTLELINPVAVCSGGSNNWTASNDISGGTPGTQNSVFDISSDILPPALINVIVNSDSVIELFFNEPMDSTNLANGIYIVNNGITVLSVKVNSTNFISVLLTINPAIVVKTIYTVTVTNVTDCPGNLIGTANFYAFVLPEQGETGDIIINEVLFDPRTGGAEFVEIYNISNKYINLQNWKLSDNTLSKETIINSQYVIFPQQYVALTKDTANIKEEYLYPLLKGGAEKFIEMSSFSTYNNDEDAVILYNDIDSISDRFDYDENMHFPLLKDADGVSLERIDFNRLTNDATNWHSAAESAGFATPGYENSQFNRAEITDDPITIDPEIFSPDNDGFNDVVNISYKFDTPGLVANVTIYDSKGRLVRYLVQSELLGTAEGTFSWDGINGINGINENGEKSRIGIYIILFEVFDLYGNVKKYKNTCVLASQLGR